MRRIGLLVLGVGALAPLAMLHCYSSDPPKDPSNETSATKTAEPTAAKPIQVDDPNKPRGDVYDKEHTEVVLNRATRQAEEHCGGATGDDGKATGPWGPIKLKLNLGHNGRMKGVTVPNPYDGKPVGKCVEKAFANLIFPPWAGADAEVEWTVDVHPPGK